MRVCGMELIDVDRDSSNTHVSTTHINIADHTTHTTKHTVNTHNSPSRVRDDYLRAALILSAASSSSLRVRKSAMVLTRPSLSGMVGSHLRYLRALVISGLRLVGSSDGTGSYVILALGSIMCWIVSASCLIVYSPGTHTHREGTYESVKHEWHHVEHDISTCAPSPTRLHLPGFPILMGPVVSFWFMSEMSPCTRSDT